MIIEQPKPWGGRAAPCERSRREMHGQGDITDTQPIAVAKRAAALLERCRNSKHDARMYALTTAEKAMNMACDQPTTDTTHFNTLVQKMMAHIAIYKYLGGTFEHVIPNEKRAP